MHLVYSIGLGIFAGICSGIFGIGGGIILVPALVYLFGYSQHAASGTSLVAMLLPVGALSVYGYYRAEKIGPDHIKVGLVIAVGIFLGAFVGSKISVGLSPVALRKIFAVFIFAVAIKLWFTK